MGWLHMQQGNEGNQGEIHGLLLLNKPHNITTVSATASTEKLHYHTTVTELFQCPITTCITSDQCYS